MVCSKSVLKKQGSFAKNSGGIYLVGYLEKILVLGSCSISLICDLDNMKGDDIIKPTSNRNILWVVISLERDLEFKTVLLNWVNILKYYQSPI